MNIRLPQKLIKYIDGVDFALWRFYVNNVNMINIKEVETLSKEVKLTGSRRIEFKNRNSEIYLKELIEKNNLSKSDVIRRCLFWLSGHTNYPTSFVE